MPALTVNRLCGSGFQAVITGAEQILTGQAQSVLVGGTESMSQAPHIIRGARWGIPLGKSDMEDSLWSSLTDSYTKMPMAITAENLAEKYGFTQDEVDTYSVESQRRFGEAQKAGYFDAEICDVVIKSRKGEKYSTLMSMLVRKRLLRALKLPKAKKDGVIHAGAASGICDSASALVMCTREFAEKNGHKPIAD